MARDADTRDVVAKTRSTLLVVGAMRELDGRLRLAVETNWPGTQVESFPTVDLARERLAHGSVDVICVRIEPPYGRALATVRKLRAFAASTPIVGIVPKAELSLVEVGSRSGASAWVEDAEIGTDALEAALGTVLVPAPLPTPATPSHTCAELLALGEEELRRLEELARAPVEPMDAPPVEDHTPQGDAAEAGVEAPHVELGERSAEPATTAVVDDGEEASAPPTHAETPSESAISLEILLARARKLVIVPIGRDGLPERDGIARVSSLDVADGTLRMTLASWTTLSGGHAIAVAEVGEARNEFAWIEHDLRASGREETFVARVRGGIEDLLDASRLEPVLDTSTMRFRYGHSDALIEAWCSIGVLAPVLVDRVAVCPRCEALPTIRLGCRRCGSARLSSERLIHHFACANVARESEYDHPSGLACAKCRARELVVNADYEYLSGPWECADCGHQCGERDPVCHCIACGERFFSRDANELELVSFHAARMEPLALLAAP